MSFDSGGAARGRSPDLLSRVWPEPAEFIKLANRHYEKMYYFLHELVRSRGSCFQRKEESLTDRSSRRPRKVVRTSTRF